MLGISQNVPCEAASEAEKTSVVREPLRYGIHLVQCHRTEAPLGRTDNDICVIAAAEEIRIAEIIAQA